MTEAPSADCCTEVIVDCPADRMIKSQKSFFYFVSFNWETAFMVVFYVDSVLLVQFPFRISPKLNSVVHYAFS
jgi:hypothetical protein